MTNLPSLIEQMFERDRIGNIHPIEDVSDWDREEAKPRLKPTMEAEVMKFIQSLGKSPVPGVAPRDVDVIAVFQHMHKTSYDEARKYLAPHTLLIRGMNYPFSS